MIENFIGEWIMDPDKNEYSTKTPPKEGSYTISIIENRELLFSMKWIDYSGKELESSYKTHVDGEKHSYENPELADFIETKMSSSNIMETITYKNEKINSKGTRELIDSKTMLVIQTMFLPDGKEIVNKSIYNKKD